MIVPGRATFAAAAPMVRVIAALVFPLMMLRSKLAILPMPHKRRDSARSDQSKQAVGTQGSATRPARSADARPVRSTRSGAVRALAARRPLDNRDGNRRDAVLPHDDVAQRGQLTAEALGLQLGRPA